MARRNNLTRCTLAQKESGGKKETKIIDWSKSNGRGSTVAATKDVHPTGDEEKRTVFHSILLGKNGGRIRPGKTRAIATAALSPMAKDYAATRLMHVTDFIT